MTERTLIIGTRGSDLALWQANHVRDRLPGPSDLRIIRTSGDRLQDKPLAQQEGIGFFTKEIEEALLAKRIDLAVHSLKDLPTSLGSGLKLAAVLVRHNPCDMLLVRPDAHDPNHPIPIRTGGTVGSSSLRRQALLKHLRPDLQAVPIRGNVPTRVEKVKRGDCDALVMARAGLERLRVDLAPLHAFDLNPGRWICAPGQGAVAVEIRTEDEEAQNRIHILNHAATRECVAAERHLLVAFGGGCHAPFGAWAERAADRYRLTACAPTHDQTFRIQRFEAKRIDEAREKAESWIQAGCPEISKDETGEWLCRPAQPWC